MTFMTFPVYAGNTNIVVDNQTGDDSLEIEVTVNGTSCMLSLDTGFKYNLDMPEKKVPVAAWIPADTYGYYNLEYENDVDISKNAIIRITVTYSDNFGDYGDDDIEVLEEDQTWSMDDYKDGLPDTGMEDIDLSGGREDAGILLISCEPVYAFDEAVLTLTDESYKTYRIPLHMEPYFFRAKVKLPAGKYRETGSPEITFNESASEDTSLTYVWNHPEGQAFGGFINIISGTETTLSKLAIKTMQNGAITDTDSRYYFNKNVYEKESEAQAESREEFMQEAYQSLVIDETLPIAEEEEPKMFNVKIIIRVAGWLLGVVLIVGFIAGVLAIYKKYKNNNRMY